MRIAKIVRLAALGLLAVNAVAQAPQATSCILCHGNAELMEQKHLDIVTLYRADVHAEVSLSCHDCHGGNPSPQLAEDMAAAMDEAYGPNPYVGVPAKKAIPEFCGRCHSSPVFMNKYRPGVRTDQVQEYWTSHHGQALRKGDEAVAACTDCHGVHGILRSTNPDSAVYPTHVAETCGGCHSDAGRMAGRQIPIDQHAKWTASVHAAAMFDKGDLTAPTCNDCHGNHSATPPGVQSVAFVCGNCHGREAELFRASPKHDGFQTHNQLLADGGDCSSCHDGLKQELVRVTHFSECVTCHENHAVIRPTIAFLGSPPETPCAFCHEPRGTFADRVKEPSDVREHYQQVRDGLLRAADAAKLEGSRRYDWLVDQALGLPTHTAVRNPGEPAVLRPEFARLFEKFRIGKAHYTYRDPSTGKEVHAPVRTCTDCHVDPEAAGFKTAKLMLDQIREVTSMTASAERLLLRAHRGGVEVRSARAELDAAVDAQIQLETLVHSFGAGSQFTEKYKEATQHAAAALAEGEKSLAELSFRRRGLFISLGVIGLVLFALGAKIRQIERRR